MSSFLKSKSRIAAAALLAGSVLAVAAFAQQPPPGGGGPGGPGGPPSPADQAIHYRQALFTLIGGNSGPLGQMAQGKMDYNGAEATKRAQNLAFLATMVADAFPDVSKTGDTKAKPEVWTNPTGFAAADKKLVDATAALVTALKTDNSAASLKTAFGAVGQTCKGCHDDFRAK
jgi:cytochrome c556